MRQAAFIASLLAAAAQDPLRVVVRDDARGAADGLVVGNSATVRVVNADGGDVCVRVNGAEPRVRRAVPATGARSGDAAAQSIAWRLRGHR